MTGYTILMVHQMKTITDAAVDAGVSFIVHLTGQNPWSRTTPPARRAKRERRFQPRGSILQHRRLCGLEPRGSDHRPETLSRRFVRRSVGSQGYRPKGAGGLSHPFDLPKQFDRLEGMDGSNHEAVISLGIAIVQMHAQRGAIYTRVSTEQGLEKDFNSLDAQREACEAYIKSQAHEGWRLVRDRYDDGGFSSGSMTWTPAGRNAQTAAFRPTRDERVTSTRFGQSSRAAFAAACG
jgi:hypothetical protein